MQGDIKMNNQSAVRALVLGFGMAFMPSLVMADVIYTSFGSLPQGVPPATFGGSGIPADAIAATSVIVDGNKTVTVALSATPRYSNPALTNNGAGTFYAQTGSNTGGNNESATTGALWNFSYYVNVSGPGADLGDYAFTLYYDFNPAPATLPGAMGSINLNGGIVGAGGNPSSMTNVQGSENLLFSYLQTNVLGIVTPPPSGSFNPLANGEYSFILRADNAFGTLGRVGINVNAVPLPAAAWLFGSALLGLGWAKRSRRQQQEVLCA